MLDGSHETDYAQSFEKLLEMIEKTLDEYKDELHQLIFPFFVVLYLTMIRRGFEQAARLFIEEYGSYVPEEELALLENVKCREQQATTLNCDKFLLNKF